MSYAPAGGDDRRPLLRRGKRDQFVAVVEFLGSGARVELQDWQVEPVEG